LLQSITRTHAATSLYIHLYLFLLLICSHIISHLEIISQISKMKILFGLVSVTLVVFRCHRHQTTRPKNLKPLWCYLILIFSEVAKLILTGQSSLITSISTNGSEMYHHATPLLHTILQRMLHGINLEAPFGSGLGRQPSILQVQPRILPAWAVGPSALY